MQIQYKYFDGRFTHRCTAEVKPIAAFRGHDRYKDADGWYYVQDKAGEWHYFDSLGEINDYISGTYWGD